MNSLVLCLLLLVFGNDIQGSSSAPIDHEQGVENEENLSEYEETTDEDLFSTRIFDQALRTNAEKNPVQEWFENLSKNTSSNAQNAMDTLKEWFAKVAEGAQNLNSHRPAVQETPTVYMGSFQLLKMPMPQFDIMKGLGDLATAAQTFNKVTGLGNSLPIPQGIPLLSQG